MKIILIAAISLDGFITKHEATGSGFTSPEDKRFYHQTIREFDSFIFGSTNFRLSREWIQKRLRPDQLKIALTRHPERLREEVVPGEIELASTPAEAIDTLASHHRRQTALLGGGKIYGLFLKEHLVDELWLTVEPLLFGGGTKLAETHLDFRGELISAAHLAPSTLLLKYRPA